MVWTLQETCVSYMLNIYGYGYGYRCRDNDNNDIIEDWMKKKNTKSINSSICFNIIHSSI